MPQLSLYIDNETYRELERRARLGKTSISKLVASILKNIFAKSWPDGYHNVFGSINDDSFARQKTSDWSMDTPREIL